MECARFDWKAYALGELSAVETAEYDRHAGTCGPCRAELGRWQRTIAPLRNLPQAEPPRRIVFVPEPGLDLAAAEPWWRRLWHSGPQLGFASAAVLALAIVAHGVLARVPAAPAPTQAQLQSLVDARVHEEALKEVNRLLPQAVDQRVRESLNPTLASMKKQLSQDEQTRLAGFEQRRDADQKAIRYAFERLERRITYATLSSARPQGGE